MKYFFAIPLAVAALGSFVYKDITARTYDGDIKQKVAAVSLEGSPEITQVKTLERPIITRQSIEKKLKNDLVRFYSYPVENIDPHLEDFEPIFDPNFFSTVEADTRATVRNLLDSEVRVVDFIVIGKPMYIGSKMGALRNWDFVVKGYSVYQGNFSRARFQYRRERKIISVIESPTRNGNPSGVEIYAIKEF